MEFEWVAIALGDVVWISVAFVLGLLASLIGLPPLVGFLVTGFVLGFFGMAGGEVLDKIADLGITLLLFTVGLKMDVRALLRPQEGRSRVPGRQDAGAPSGRFHAVTQSSDLLAEIFASFQPRETRSGAYPHISAAHPSSRPIRPYTGTFSVLNGS